MYISTIGVIASEPAMTTIVEIYILRFSRRRFNIRESKTTDDC